MAPVEFLSIKTKLKIKDKTGKIWLFVQIHAKRAIHANSIEHVYTRFLSDYLCQGSYVFVGISLFLCLFVCQQH